MAPKILLILSSLLCLMSSESFSDGLKTSLRPVLRRDWNEAVLFNDLVRKYGVYFKNYSVTPFTGESVKYFESGPLMRKRFYKDGKRHGLEEWYHEMARSGEGDPIKMGRNTGFTNGILKGTNYFLEKNGKTENGMVCMKNLIERVI